MALLRSPRAPSPALAFGEAAIGVPRASPIASAPTFRNRTRSVRLCPLRPLLRHLLPIQGSLHAV